MSVEVMFMGRLGNNLFQYSLGRIVAEQLGFELICREYPMPTEMDHIAAADLGHSKSVTLISVAAEFPNVTMRVRGNRYWHPTEDYILGSRMWRGQTLDLQKILADRSPRQIRLAGFFQRYEYYRPYIDRIRCWFSTRQVKDHLEISSHDVLVNIRGGADFAFLGWILDPQYYVHALEGMARVGKVYVCGVGITAGFREALAQFEPIYIDGCPMDHFRLIQKFNRIIIPNSTFSWWAALLSSAAEIYIPKVLDLSRYSFKMDDVDLDVDSPRYIGVPCEFAFTARTFVSHRFW